MKKIEGRKSCETLPLKRIWILPIEIKYLSRELTVYNSRRPRHGAFWLESVAPQSIYKSEVRGLHNCDTYGLARYSFC
jgi:hypothetical protein